VDRVLLVTSTLVFDGDQFIYFLSQVPKFTNNWILLEILIILNTPVRIFHVFRFYLQMHHPIQMKPADSENRNGE
jgi:hypothetical protein